MEKNLDKVRWFSLSVNPNAIPILEKNLDKVCWKSLSVNVNAISILENNFDKIDWDYISMNPNAISILEKNRDKIDWYNLSRNPSICIVYDYQDMKRQRSWIHEELAMAVYHPRHVMRHMEQYNYNLCEDEELK